jgi:hypothetical protein
LANRNQPPASATVATVQGIRGEPVTPTDPSRGQVWSAIRDAVHERESLHRLVEAVTSPGVRQVDGRTAPIYTQPTLEEIWADQAAVGG